ncbi:NlpC/P60 family protein [Streptomyces sp. NPDC001985]|uniref:C40 family peptidase n=1 Tax=Streptomyces sp. NPDC001985 TaxID=3154406 RepID=UPI003323AC68
MNRRRCAIAAITLACALSVLAAPGTALAAPAPLLPRVPSAPLLPRAPEPPAPAPSPADTEKSLNEVRLEIEDLYHRAVSATDAYNQAKEEAERQSAEIVELARSIDKGRKRIDDLRALAGAAARAQYQGGGLPPEAYLVLTDDPELFLDGVDRVKQGMKATKDLLDELEQTQSELEAYTRDASAQWRALEATRAQEAEAKKEITERIAAAEELERRLEKKERARMLELEREAAERAQEEWLRARAADRESAGAGEAGGGAGNADEAGRASGAAGKAVEFARAQLGKPYEWGAEGPGSYDCSGLTSQAWAAAGVPIPRTSQEQWRRLPRVGVEDLRPGDLIIYHADASHVGMYTGGGSIVHAPRPGRDVTVAGAGSMKILGVVRPSAQE